MPITTDYGRDILYQVSRQGAETIAGRPLTDDEALRIARALPMSSIGEAVEEVVYSVVGGSPDD
jgi:hypothetical protein